MNDNVVSIILNNYSMLWNIIVHFLYYLGSQKFDILYKQQKKDKK